MGSPNPLLVLLYLFVVKAAMTIAVYCCDILLVGNNIALLEKVRAELDECFSLRELGEANSFLGVIMKYRYGGIKISLRDYLSGLRENFKSLTNSHPLALPANSRVNLDVIPCQNDEKCDAKRYRLLIKKPTLRC